MSANNIERRGTFLPRHRVSADRSKCTVKINCCVGTQATAICIFRISKSWKNPSTRYRKGVQYSIRT